MMLCQFRDMMLYDAILGKELIMRVTFEIVCTCICIQNTNAHEMLGDSHKYLTFVSTFVLSHL